MLIVYDVVCLRVNIRCRMFCTISYISIISLKNYDIVCIHTISYVWHTISYVSSCGLYTMLYVGQKSDACGGDVVGCWYRRKRKHYMLATEHLDSLLWDSTIWWHWDSNGEPIDSKRQLDHYAKEPSHLPCSQRWNDGIYQSIPSVIDLSGICCQWNI